VGGGILSQAPSVRGPPNSTELIQTRSNEAGSSSTSQSSFSIGVSFAVSLISSQPASLLCLCC